jgi:transcriptional regulator with XRE-family HTH domain
MDYYTASDSAILKELGKRIRSLRLRKNITQEALAERALIAVGTLKSLEAGKGTTLSNLIAVLRELESLDQLDQFIPPVTISPLKIAAASAKITGTGRVRASATVHKSKKNERDN